ncbi:MAG: AAA family ATPase [Thermodesulfovibrionia bacterium]|nr:AAA family ATPase [Thermodesulfovibrionia bacterium]
MKNLSIGATIAWQIAAYEAAESGYRYIENWHLLIGILSLEKVISDGPEKSGIDQNAWQELKAEHLVFKKILRAFGIEQTRMRRSIRKNSGKGNYKHSEKTIHRSEECKAIFKRADTLSGSSAKITTLHIAAAIMENPGDTLKSIFSEIGIDLKELKDNFLSPPEKALARENEEQADKEEPHSYLERYGRDMTKAAKEGKLGPFVGRRNELLQVIQTLARSMKNNPVLVGEAGVGKTAIVEALSVRAAQGKDPQVLSGKKIIELNMGALLGGTKYRGEFEERLTKIIEEVRADANIIIFIDEIHNLVGAGRVGGSMDAANIMKPALARGDIKCIGATTIGEYRRYIESDPALERRFEKIIINEPTRDEAVEILKGIRPKWEKHFNKKITDKALQTAVDLAIRFDTDHHLPDKAVDLVDKAGARVQVPFLSMVQSIKPDDAKAGEASNAETVTEHTIAEVLSDKTGIPLEIIKGNLEGISGARLLELSTFLKFTVGRAEKTEDWIH